MGCSLVGSDVQLFQEAAEKELAFLPLASNEQLESLAVLDCISQCLLSLRAEVTAVNSAQDCEATIN